jgi:predicted Zn finger-like uncharacterized protein
MKCPNCRSQMFITDETITEKSHVVFSRCSLCVSEHVSSEPIMNSLQRPITQQATGFLGTAAARTLYAV